MEKDKIRGMAEPAACAPSGERAFRAARALFRVFFGRWFFIVLENPIRGMYNPRVRD
jgi:hypothetical protein